MVNKKCLTTLEEKIKYLGSVDLVMLHNNMRFDTTDFTDASVIRESILINQQFNER